MKFTNFKTIKLATAPTTGDNPPSGAIYEWHSLDESNNLVINYRLPDGTNKTFSGGTGTGLTSVAVDGTTITGDGTPENPLEANVSGSSNTVSVLGTSGNVDIDRAVSCLFSCTPTGALAFRDCLNFSDGQEAIIRLVNPNNLVSFPISWNWEGDLPAQVANGYNLIKLTATSYNSSIMINATALFTYRDLSASLMLYLKFDGVNDSTTIVDDTGRHTSFTLIGAAAPNNTCLKTAIKYSGSASLRNTGWGGGLRVASSPDFALPDLFTIEFQLYPNANSGGNALVGITSFTNFEIAQYNAQLRVWLNGTNHDTSANVLTAEAWHKIAVTRNASNLVSLWVNGTSVMSFTDGTPITADALSIFCRGNSSGNFDGYMDELKFYTGVCLYN